MAKKLIIQRIYHLKPLGRKEWTENLAQVNIDLNNNAKDNIYLKRNSNDIISITVNDLLNGKDFNFEINLFITYYANKFIENPEGTLSIKLNNDIMQFLQQNKYLENIAKFRFSVIGDKEKRIITLSFDDNDDNSKNKLSTDDALDHIMIEGISQDDKTVSRIMLNLFEAEIDKIDDDLILYIIYQETKIPLFITYTPIFIDDQIINLKSPDNLIAGKPENELKKNKIIPIKQDNKIVIDDLRRRVHEIEVENTQLTTKLTKEKV